MAARRGRRDRLAPPPSGGPGPDPGGGVRGSSRGSRSQVPYGTVGTVSGGEQVLLHEEVDDSGFVSLSRLGPCLKDKDLEMEALMLQDETLLGTMQSYMDASLISLIEDFGSLGESRLSLEDQNEVSLLTALTEILDNADSENLSPFDSIPDSELLVSPREGSSLHKLLTLSRTPSERDLITPVDPLGPTTGSSRVEMSLADPPWDFSPPSFLETSSPKLPSWRPTRSRPRRSQSLSPQQRSDGEEEEEVASFSSHILIGERDNSMSSIPDFPMHLACPEEEDKTAAAVAEMAVQAAGDESISSLSELVRAMHPYCLPNLTHLTSLENELQEQPDDLTLPDDCVVLEIVGQAATAGNDLEIPVVVRQIPPGPQPVLLDDSLEANPALQLLLPTVEPEPKEALCPEKEELALDPEEKLESACFLDPTEVVEPTVPKGPQNVPVSAVLSSQRARKGRRKKSKEQPVACTEGYARRLRSSSRGQPAVATEVTSQAGILPQEELQREVGPLHGRGKPRAWARAWTAIVEKPSSGNAESSARQASLTKEGPLDLYPNLGETIKTDLVPGHLSLVDSARANPMLLDSAEADPTAVDPVGGEHVPADCALVDLSSANSELVDPLSADPVLIEPVLADSATIDCTVVVPISGDLPPVDPASANPAPVAPVPDDLAPVNPVLVKSRPTDPRRGAISSAQGSPAPQLLLKSESLDPPKGIIPKVREVMGPLKVESGTSAAIQEARPRPLSLSEYRRRRQQRQGEAEERSSQPPAGKWPSLPETPTGLADIPCLVIPPAPVKKTALQRSPEAPEAGFVPVGPSPASPSPDPPASKPVTSTLTEQVPSQEMPLPARPPAPTVQSVPPTIPTALPFPPGIEASDLSSLLEQFEKSEAKKECPPPAPADNLAVGNSGSVDPPQEKRPLDRLQAPELANVAGLTPPATPPHQLWKPLAAVSLLAKAKSPKSTAQEGTLKPEGVTEAKHPAAARLQEGVHGPSPVHVGSGDHDYCVRSRTPPKKTPVLVFPEAGSRWNVKRHQDITIKPVLSLGPAAPLPPRIATCKEPLDHRTSNEQADPPAPCLAPSALLSPEASPCRNDMNTRTPPEPSAKRRSMRCYRKACRSASPQSRGWQGRRGRSSSVSSGSNLTSEASSSSSSSSSRSRSRSLSPPHKRWRRSSCSSSGHSRRCSSSSSSSSSSSCSRSRSRSPSPRRRSDRRRRYSSYRSHDHYQRQRVLQKERAIEERRVVFIGKIPGRMTRSELKQRFSVFGEIEECTIHFRVQGDNYGFVTYRYAEEAFAAIESGHKLRQADEQPFDLCFGGRRQFCKRSYSDLDSNREDFDPAPVKSKFDSLDFDTLLKQAQKNLRR
uniref:Peroxisome proliferator-activated receptor gamma coactivator-related protein 1 n=1 Tax=Rousettus aegyptiacus TaxID=9407 RepID=A0A7J8GDX2_ROUAE|nr:PPARG related coactivator 1 [Rousettus aegyptiacus]